jgi:hypothetical protein
MNADEMKQFVTPDLDPRKNADHLFMYKGLNCRQTPRVLDSLDVLCASLASDTPSIIVEIGTFHGAFTQVLKDHDICATAKLHTFDIVDFKKPQISDVTYHVGDVFHDQLGVIKQLVSTPGRCLVFCDGGNKEREISTFCSLLKKGDIILCHDYVKTLAVMQDKSIVGNWPEAQYESQWKNIGPALEQNNFLAFEELTMQKAMWGCFIKN